MGMIKIELDSKTEMVLDQMAKDESISPEQLSKIALQDYLKKFTQRCITTTAT